MGAVFKAFLIFISLGYYLLAILKILNTRENVEFSPVKVLKKYDILLFSFVT